MDAEDANGAACLAVAAGAEEITFRHAKIETVSDVAIFLANLNEIPVAFEGLSIDTFRIVAERLKSRPHHAAVACGFGAAWVPVVTPWPTRSH